MIGMTAGFTLAALLRSILRVSARSTSRVFAFGPYLVAGWMLGVIVAVP
jgi:hypothetical protein